MGTEIVELSSDDECEKALLKRVKESSGFCVAAWKTHTSKTKTQSHCKKRDAEENRSSTEQSAVHSCSSVLDQGLSTADDTGLSSSSPACPPPLCRQFWKSGNYAEGLASKGKLQNGKNYLHVHPMFLHSNATSHKWAFGAIAELLDNAIDEIQNGATFVIVDKTSIPRNQSQALLIQDNGGGMSPDAMRHCMSFGFSEKKSKSSIGQYGNGFKTSTMRLGADVIVFSRHKNNRILTQSIGLLSYTFLTQTGLDRIVVPMVDYEFNSSSGTLKVLHSKEHFSLNLSLLLQWSPYRTEAELLKQFDDIGANGTKIIVYNLWCNDDGNLELDFETDPEDIRLAGEKRKIETIPAWKEVNEQHIANRFHYSLREYLSILYLRIPESFNIILCGRTVKPHNIADDLKFPEYILYKPQTVGSLEGSVVTTIGFLKEAPHVNIHGFNVYHKNRLILPFWQVVNYSDSRGRGVVGILQADFVEPTHNKQDFERTYLFLKLEVRLREMTWEYWDYHCVLIGYQQKKKPRIPIAQQLFPSSESFGIELPVQLKQSSYFVGGAGLHIKRKTQDNSIVLERVKKLAVKGTNESNMELSRNKQALATSGNSLTDQETANMMLENQKLRLKCSELEKNEKELQLKATWLKVELKLAQRDYIKLVSALKALDGLKEERAVYRKQILFSDVNSFVVKATQHVHFPNSPHHTN